MKYLVKFAKFGRMAYISHLDLQRLLLRALRMSGLKPAYSKGFSPHPKLSIALPLSLGFTSTCEYFEFELAEHTTLGTFPGNASPAGAHFAWNHFCENTESMPIDEFPVSNVLSETVMASAGVSAHTNACPIVNMTSEIVMARLNQVLPEGLAVLSVQVSEGGKSIASKVRFAAYEITAPRMEMMEDRARAFLELPEIIFEKKDRKSGRIMPKDIRSMIQTFEVASLFYDRAFLTCVLGAGSGGSLNPQDLMGVFYTRQNKSLETGDLIIRRTGILT